MMRPQRSSRLIILFQWDNRDKSSKSIEQMQVACRAFADHVMLFPVSVMRVSQHTGLQLPDFFPCIIRLVIIFTTNATHKGDHRDHYLIFVSTLPECQHDHIFMRWVLTYLETENLSVTGKGRASKFAVVTSIVQRCAWLSEKPSGQSR